MNPVPNAMNHIPKLLACLTLSAAVAFDAGAASLRISPIGLDIPTNERAASMTLVNTATEPVDLQLRLFKWEQHDGEDVLEPTTDMLVTPPATTIPPGASYTVRVARTHSGSAGSEESYRLFIDELPKPTDPKTVGQGVSMVLRTSLPIFVVDPKAYSNLQWQVWQDAEGLHVKATNVGKRHAKLAELALHTGQGDAISAGQGLNGYVLAGSSRVFDIKPMPGAHPALLPANAALTVTATDNGQPVNANIHIDNDASH